MTRNEKILLIGGGIIALILATSDTFKAVLKRFLETWELFSPIPYWDVKQWSWGFGTKVPGSTTDRYNNPGGSITRTQAMTDAMNHVTGDYTYLKPLLHVSLNPYQWAAFLSFAYNLGRGNADNLVNNINSRNWAALEDQWKQYVYADGQVNQNLVDRRKAEWELFIS